MDAEKLTEKLLKKLRQDKIVLHEDEHVYEVFSHPHLKFTSATTFIGEFFEPFDAEGVSEKLADSDRGKYAHMNQKEILAKWDWIAERGTDVHKELEDWCFHWMSKRLGNPPEKPYEVTLTKAKHGVNWLERVLEPHFLLFPEVKLFSPKLQLAGTLDLLIYNPELDLFIIEDWKTNAKITKSGYMGKRGIKNATRFMDDCKFNKYGLQMSLYRWILENEYGLNNILKQILVQLRPKPTNKFPLGVKEYYTPYFKPNIEKMVEYRLGQKERGELFEHLL